MVFEISLIPAILGYPRGSYEKIEGYFSMKKGSVCMMLSYAKVGRFIYNNIAGLMAGKNYGNKILPTQN